MTEDLLPIAGHVPEIHHSLLHGEWRKFILLEDYLVLQRLLVTYETHMSSGTVFMHETDEMKSLIKEMAVIMERAKVCLERKLK